MRASDGRKGGEGRSKRDTSRKISIWQRKKK